MSEPFLGQIEMFGGNFAPRGWALCDGQLIAITQNQALFALLGTTYGGDGRVTFALPNLRGRIPVHAGSGPGLTPRVLGERSGAETASLTVDQIASHSHAQDDPILNAAVPGTVPNTSDPASASVASVMTYSNPATDTLDADMHADSIEHPASAAVGQGQPHENMMPFLTVNFIIALTGVFPSRN